MVDIPTPLPPLPQPNVQLTTETRGTSQAHAPWFAGVDAAIRNDVLTVAGGKTITGGFQYTENPDTIAAAAITPNPSAGLKQSVTNNAALTINATAQIGDVELHVTNGPTAGAITFSGFTKQWTGDALDTVNGHQFIVFIYGFSGARAYLIRALQ